MSEQRSQMQEQHALLPAMQKGLFCRCPRCGEGDHFNGFLQQVEHCGNCGEPLERYNVGLLLPFVVIMIVAHVIIFVMLEMELSGSASAGVYIAVLVPLSVIVPLLVIRPIKGAIIGFLWARNVSDELNA